MSILPKHKQNLDKKIDELFGIKIDELDVSTINILAKSCDERLLKHLAVSFDVDIDGLSVDEARKMVANAFEIHLYSGTFYGLAKALKASYAGAKPLEWFEYDGEPFHFKLEIDTGNKGVKFNELQKVDEVANTYKNVRSVFDGATIKLGINTNLNTGCLVSTAEEIKIYPTSIKNISTKDNYFIGAYAKLAEIINIQIINLKGELE
ncbi:phage P2 family tail protein [Campylobacter pinnipediorum subsp. caledonicus]|uniref:Phage P2 family tail protein n=1 Tax=Campylobacter pinnipediorum subsp. caledonicus TaxID=1874362 RepID=A0A1S6U886_9BACT|nr:phage tail protein [Campylobacter pinnipediorum]AQW85488.1 phage P2 family tail protein [Campylobacter pinnipediorum subsp. caledonicus]AQW87900.1 phage P2 family tail protein [Campylobacter pinnipediorum subsp. caledonicus]